MNSTLRLFLGLWCVSLWPGSALADEPSADEIPTALFDYVKRPEPAYSWKVQGVQSLGSGRLYDVDLTSQQWHGITWKHVLQIHEPEVIEHPKHVLLFVTGGVNGRRPGDGETEMGVRLARMTGSRVAVLYQVPNQPLMGNRVEDDLITETWLRYLETGDATWPLLFPMVKSAVKAMDAIEAIAAERWNGSIEGFVITGASKRGWTSWLTPVADKRIIATAPIVIDVLNFRAQMKHQLDTWGRYSEQIKDYTSKGLIQEGDETPRETQLRVMMDPYTYRRQLTLPKLLVNGTNDPYWVVDAMQWYWDDLVGPKYVLQVPNAGHGLDGGRERAFATVAVFFRHAAAKRALPALHWEHAEAAGEMTLKIQCDQEPVAARLWVAQSDTKDFRGSRWRSQSLVENSGTYAGTVSRPAEGHVAYFGELEFRDHGIPYSLCTLIHREKEMIIRTDQEWRELLTPEQYHVLREKGTERPFQNEFDHHFEAGKYVCAACGQELFASDAKFNSGCGWPAFYAAQAGDRVQLTVDSSLGMIRTEVTCSRCDSHLGHIFDDAPQTPTGQRYCINSVSLKFIPAADPAPEKAEGKE